MSVESKLVEVLAAEEAVLDPDDAASLAEVILKEIPNILHYETMFPKMRDVISGVLDSGDDGGKMDDIDWVALRTILQDANGPEAELAPLITEPLSQAKVRKMIGQEGEIVYRLVLDLDDLNGDLEELNDLVTDKFSDRLVGLQGLSYKIVGHSEGNGHGTFSGDVIVEVSAFLDETEVAELDEASADDDEED